MKFQFIHLKKILYILISIAWIMIIIHQIHYLVLGDERDFEYPIGYLEDVSIYDDKLYILSKSYARIQVYNIDGNFLFGFNLGTISSMYIQDEIIHVLLHRMNQYNQYSLDGVLMESTKLDRTQELEMTKKFEAVPKDENCKIKYNYIYPTIFINRNSGEFVKIQSPFYLFFITFPFPVVLYMSFLFTVESIKKVKKDKKRIFSLIKKKNFYKL